MRCLPPRERAQNDALHGVSPSNTHARAKVGNTGKNYDHHFNHTIVASRDKQQSAEFLADLFGLPSPKPFGHFMVVALDHGASLDYADAPEGEEIRRQHYAFLVSEQDFDAIYGKIKSRGLQHWADPGVKTARRDQPPRRRPRGVLPGSLRACHGDPDPSLRLGRLVGT